MDTRPQVLDSAEEGAVPGTWHWARPRLIARVDALVSSLLAEPSEVKAEAEKRLAEELHRLAGTFGCYGFEQGSLLARELELSVVRGKSKEFLFQQLSALRSSVEGTKEPAYQQQGYFASVAFICEDDSLPSLELISFAQAKGIRLVPISAGEFGSGSWDAWVYPLQASSEVPFPNEAPLQLCLLPEDTIQARVAAVQGGANLVLPAMERPRIIVDQLLRGLESLDNRPRRLLVLDDDPDTLDMLSFALPLEKYAVKTCCEADGFLEELELFSPDLVLIDLNMADVRGDVLCRVLRSDPQWCKLPVIFMTGDRSEAAAKAIYEAGGDDVLLKPVDIDVLLFKLGRHWANLRLVQDQMIDEVTGLSNRRLATREFERLLGIARRQNASLTVSLIDLDHFKNVNDSYGHFTGDQVLSFIGQLLRKNYRREDVIGRWGGEEFIVVQLNCSGRQALDRLQFALERLNEKLFVSGTKDFRVSFSAGVAVFPTDGRSVRALYTSADRALYDAKRSGRSRARLASQASARPIRSQNIDVVLLEDDEELRALLSQAFETRHFTFKHFSCAEDVYRALSVGEFGKPKVLLIDHKLPGMSGLALLRQLFREGKLTETIVVTVSGEMTEAEILDCLALGAWEHVPKPFNVRLLVRTVERLLHSRSQRN